MDKIELQIKTVCLVSMFAGIISAVIPQGRLKGAFSSFCAMVVIFHLISPLTQIKTEGLKMFVYEKEKEEESLLVEVRTAEVMFYENTLQKALEKELKKQGHNVLLEVTCEKSGDEIIVLLFTVSGKLGEEEKAEIEKILKKGFQEADVEFKEEING